MSISREMDQDVACILTGILLGHKNGTMPFAATWMATAIVILHEESQTEKEVLSDTPSMWNLKRNDTNELTRLRGTHRLHE